MRVAQIEGGTPQGSARVGELRSEQFGVLWPARGIVAEGELESRNDEKDPRTIRYKVEGRRTGLAGCTFHPMTTPPSSPPEDRSLTIEALVRDWAVVIRRAASRFGLDQAEQDELVQEVRIRVWRALERNQGRPEELLPSYGYSAAVSASIDLIRKRRPSRTVTVVPLDSIAETLAAAGSLGTTEADLVAALERGLASLDPPRRIAVQLHLRGHSLDEVARIAGWTSAKARNLVYRGLEDLRSAIEQRKRGVA